MRRAAIVVSAVIALIGFSVTLGGAAWSAASAPSTAVITFDDAAQQAQLTIPTPACPATQPDCQWKFFLNEPKLSVDVGTVFGTSGTLTIPYPKDFCGVIQADAYVGPPWVPKRGFQHTIEDCHTPASTTTTTVPPTTTTSTTSTTSTTLPPKKPTPVPTTTIPVPPPSPPPAPPTPTPPPAVVPPPPPPPLTQLPFTGRDMKPFLFVGLTLAALGLCLLTSSESWRRMARRLRAVRAVHLALRSGGHRLRWSVALSLRRVCSVARDVLQVSTHPIRRLRSVRAPGVWMRTGSVPGPLVPSRTAAVHRIDRPPLSGAHRPRPRMSLAAVKVLPGYPARGRSRGQPRPVAFRRSGSRRPAFI